ncbi:MAG: hypothetical protein QM611_00245 [Microbacterium sp.]|uniref:hypothetical protein n=1 Tax=Microbacterium sp. TaxID=51671 RepID=UPI0039E637C8
MDRHPHQFDGDSASQLGRSLAYLPGAPRPILAAGAPGYTDSGRDSAGAVRLFVLRTDGTVHKQKWLTQNSAGVPGKSEHDDYFGWSLASTGKALVVGAPFEDIGSVSDAGQATLLYRTGQLTFTGRAIHQNSAGVPDKAQRYDNFGYSVAAGLKTIAIGVPNESFGSIKGAGAVQPFRYRGGTKISAWSLRHQNYPGIPGSNESYDGWGMSVAMVRPCAGKTGIVVGAPNEDVGLAVDSGAAALVTLNGGASCKSKSLAQGGALGDSAEDYDYAGTTVGIQRTSTKANATDGIVVGITGEDNYRGRATFINKPYTTAATTVSYEGFNDFDWFGGGLNTPR